MLDALPRPPNRSLIAFALCGSLLFVCHAAVTAESWGCASANDAHGRARRWRLDLGIHPSIHDPSLIGPALLDHRTHRSSFNSIVRVRMQQTSLLVRPLALAHEPASSNVPSVRHIPVRLPRLNTVQI
jgi:hypothetical protein